MKTKIYGAAEATMIFFSILVIANGSAWCERTGKIDIMLVGLGFMIVAKLIDILREAAEDGRI